MDIKQLFSEEGESIFYVKLVGGESVIGRSNDTTETINERGAIELWDVLKTHTRLLVGEDGGVSEMMVLTPWLEACDLRTVANIPIDTIVAIATCKMSIARKYRGYVLAYHIKAAAQEDAEALAEMNAERQMNDLSKMEPTGDGPLGRAQAAVRAAREAAAMHQPVEIEAQEPRQPELLTRERMMEAEMNDDLELPEEDKKPDEKEPHYKIGSITVH